MPNVDAASSPLYLHSVTLDWPREGEGDFRAFVWAGGLDEAVAKAAAAMADTSPNLSEQDRLALIDDIVGLADESACERVMDTVLFDITQLLAGPGGMLTEQAQTDLAAIEEILKRYNAS